MAGTLTTEDLEAIWDRYQAGITPAKIARDIGRDRDAVRLQINAAGGIRPTIPGRADRHLTLEEREEISRGLAAGLSLETIARRLGRAASTVSREVSANGGRHRYRASAADRDATVRRRRPKLCRLAANQQLRQLVTDGLALEWSPEQIAGWLRVEYPDRPEMWVSHETMMESHRVV